MRLLCDNVCPGQVFPLLSLHSAFRQFRLVTTFSILVFLLDDGFSGILVYQRFCPPAPPPRHIIAELRATGIAQEGDRVFCDVRRLT